MKRRREDPESLPMSASISKQKAHAEGTSDIMHTTFQGLQRFQGCAQGSSPHSYTKPCPLSVFFILPRMESSLAVSGGQANKQFPRADSSQRELNGAGATCPPGRDPDSHPTRKPLVRSGGLQSPTERHIPKEEGKLSASLTNSPSLLTEAHSR